MSLLTIEDIRTTARATVAALATVGFSCCLVGSAACSTYGLKRVPNDVDMLVLTDSMDTEAIKALVVATDPKFYLVRSTNRFNTYRVLWYTLSFRQCKVDILTPGILGIPSVPSQRIQTTSTTMPGVPAMPFLAVLLLKLKAWTDHRDSLKSYMRLKQFVDVRDIDELLKIAVEAYGLHLRQEKWLSSQFVREAKERIRQYECAFPASVRRWNAIGFTV